MNLKVGAIQNFLDYLEEYLNYEKNNSSNYCA